MGPEWAGRWYDGLRYAIANSLSYMPGRFPISEDGCLVYSGVLVRQMTYGTGRLIYRILYYVIEPTEDEIEGSVRILRIRHAAMRPLGESGDA